MTDTQYTARKPRRVKGCYNCSQRRINCDRGTPCRKCVKKGLECGGLGIRYRFNDGLASRGKLARRRIPIPFNSTPPSLSRPRDDLQSYQKTKESQDGASDDALQNSLCPGTTLRAKPLSYNNPPSSRRNALLDAGPLYALDHIDHRSRFLLDYFSGNVAPAMVAISVVFNGYRDLILPLSEQDIVMRNAVLAAATSHISLRDISWKPLALRYRVDAIKGLKQRIHSTHVDEAHSYSSLSTMVLLLIDEMIAVRADFHILLRMIRSFIQSKGDPQRFETTSLGRFLMQQIRKILLYAEPITSGYSSVTMLENISPKDLDFIYCLLETHPEHSETIFKLASLIHKAARIYIARATGVTHDVIAYLVQQFLTEASIFNASSPGGHILIWPFFIVGAECTSDRDREFISIQLQKLWELTGFGNIVYAIQFLRTVWQKDSGENWTHNLAEEAKGFIM